MVKFTDAIDANLEIAQGTVASPTFRAFTANPGATAFQVSGLLMPDTANSTINFKVSVPPGLDTNPDPKIRIFLISLATTTDDFVKITVKTRAAADGEAIDASFIDEVATNVTLTDLTNTVTVQDIPLVVGSDISAGDFIVGQLERNVGADDGEDVLITKIQLIVDVDAN